MPPKRAAEGKEPGECILTIGKFNNVVVWNARMVDVIGKLFGDMANFLTTNERHEIPFPIESDYVPVVPAAMEGGPAPMAINAALITKLREDCFTGRRKEIAQQKNDEKKIWSIMWECMSPASQSKVREEPGYAAAALSRDCVALWDMIRRTHLTHIFGEGDPMLQLNIREQEMKYAALKQGDREYVINFKTRFDAQIQANVGAGVTPLSEPRMALDFLHKLVQKRFSKMLAHMRNNALFNDANAYPRMPRTV